MNIDPIVAAVIVLVLYVTYPLFLTWLICRAIRKGAEIIAFGLGRKREELRVPEKPKEPVSTGKPLRAGR